MSMIYVTVLYFEYDDQNPTVHPRLDLQREPN
jgi:hypothetical protein